jgi:tetratricopeptide (TPR) repeat protein
MNGRFAVVLTVLLLPAMLGADDPRILRGEMRLQRQQWNLAIDLFRRALADDPASVRAKRGLGVALSRGKRCAEALPLLADVRGTPEWTAEAAIAEGDCRERHGDVPGGLAAYEEALLLDPDSGEALYRLALTRGSSGDPAGAEAALDAIDALESPRGAHLRPLAEAWLAADRGGDEAWLALDDLRRRVAEAPTPSANIEADVIEGLLWLDAADPIAAERALARAGAVSRAPTRAASWRAEALRRAGLAEEAAAVFERHKVEVGDLPVKRAVMGRIAIDRGRLHEAREILAGSPPEDPEILASAWYLARAEGDAAGMAAAEARWRRVSAARDRRLEHLIPWTAEAP